MKIRIKRRGAFGVKRVELEGKIEKIEKKESVVSPGKEGLAIYFKGLDGLGVINLSHREIETLRSKIIVKEKVERKAVKRKKKK